MNYYEALKIKETIESPYTKNGKVFRVFITPNNDKDNKNYMDNARSIQSMLNDSHAIQYSSNSQFKIRGLCFEGIIVTWDDLS